MLTASDLTRYRSPRQRAHIARAALLAILVVDLVAVWSSQAECALIVVITLLTRRQEARFERARATVHEA